MSPIADAFDGPCGGVTDAQRLSLAGCRRERTTAQTIVSASNDE